VKVINPLDDSKQQQQQLEELIAAVNYNHPNLLRCFSAGEFKFMNSQFLYLVMELAEHSLEKYLENQTLSLGQVKHLLEQVALGLNYLHREQRQVHCDLKPGNVLWVDRHWVIADFGLVKKLLDKSSISVSSNKIAGSLPYMPAEAFDGKISSAWDMWSLGIMAVAATNKGKLPYEYSGQTDLIKKVMGGELKLPKLPPVVDDFALFSDDRQFLVEARFAIEEYLAQLRLKPSMGLTFLVSVC